MNFSRGTLRTFLVSIIVTTIGLWFAGCSTDSTLIDSSGFGKSSKKAITAFSFASLAAAGIVSEASHSVSITVPYGTAVSALVPMIVHTGAIIVPVSGTAQDFSVPLTYLVTAEDSSTQAYTVIVSIAPAPPASVPVPQQVYASDGVFPDKVTISWREIAGQAVYHVYRSGSAAGELVEIGTAIDVQYNDTYPAGEAGETRYWYAVKAELSGQFSSASARNSGYRSKNWALYGPVCDQIGSIAGLISTPRDELLCLIQKPDNSYILMQNDGADWIGMSPPMTVRQFSDYAVASDGAIYFAALEGDGTYTASTVKVLRYQDEAWSAIGNNISAGQKNIWSASIALDAADRPWVSYAGGGSHVCRFANGAWEELPPIREVIDSDYPPPAFSNALCLQTLTGQAVPALIWYDNIDSSKPTVIRMDQFQNDSWVSLGAFPAEIGTPKFYDAVSANGAAYIACRGPYSGQSVLVVYKVTPQACNLLPISGLPTNPGNSCRLMVDLSGKVFLGYADWERNTKASVVSLADPDNGISWEQAGRQDISNDGVEIVHLVSMAGDDFIGFTMNFLESGSWIKHTGVFKLW